MAGRVGLTSPWLATGDVLSQQQRIKANWWKTTRGGLRPNRAERVANARNGGSSSHAPTPGVSMGRTPNSQLSHARDEDVSMDDAPTNTWSFGSIIMRAETPPPMPSRTQQPPPARMGGFRCDAPGYLGQSAADALDLAPPAVGEGEFRVWHGLPNTLGTVREVGRHYAFANPTTWTSGIRNALSVRPARGGDDVHVGDALAFQTLIALGPADRRNRAHQWRGFFEPAILMLSIPGFYAYIMAAGGYPPATIDAEHFRGPTDNTTMPVEL
ncbi:hypothetical protein C8R47DRAFT_1079686 [Mycena vitilis]|nr:hypothetical protein C8R47DRAFT_1079686 [Mycena vitilis]